MCNLGWFGIVQPKKKKKTRDKKCTLTLALRDGPVARIPGLARLGLLSKPHRTLLGGKFLGERGDRRQRRLLACCRLIYRLARFGSIAADSTTSWQRACLAERHVCERVRIPSREVR